MSEAKCLERRLKPDCSIAEIGEDDISASLPDELYKPEAVQDSSRLNVAKAAHRQILLVQSAICFLQITGSDDLESECGIKTAALW